MTDDALQLLQENSHYATLLRAYERARTETVREADGDAEDVGWSPRLAKVAGIDADRLAPMHGKLIAHGLLNFQLTGRMSGVVYRVSPEGHTVLKQYSASESNLAVEATTAAAEREDEYRADAAA